MAELYATLIVLLTLFAFLQVYRPEKSTYHIWHVSYIAEGYDGEISEGAITFTLSRGVDAPPENVVAVWRKEIAKAIELPENNIIIRCWMPMSNRKAEIE